MLFQREHPESGAFGVALVDTPFAKVDGRGGLLQVELVADIHVAVRVDEISGDRRGERQWQLANVSDCGVGCHEFFLALADLLCSLGDGSRLGTSTA
ncbi:MAG: hypothetical protein GX678_03760 [Actinomycetales bacterium]|nr:hypothetical protein [Actinomycetales bacterium]